ELEKSVSDSGGEERNFAAQISAFSLSLTSSNCPQTGNQFTDSISDETVEVRIPPEDFMKPIRLQLPDSPTSVGVPEIFEGGAHSVVRRAVVIGTGFAGSENQSLGLVRALGLYDQHVLYRVTRPRGGINEWLKCLPVSLHKFIYYIISMCSRVLVTARAKKVSHIPTENGSGAGLASILEADVKQIVNMAHDSYEKDGPLLVVASGRDTISVASSIKRLASDKVFVIQIQHPRSHLNRFDMVITPRHDYFALTPEGKEQVPRFMRRWITPQEPPDEHVVLTTGALHQIDFSTLRSAASTWHDELAPLPKPLLVVNVGGPAKFDLPSQMNNS
ncbi:Mitochondrial fission protein ELM1, partial [Linum grandiflorum]